MGDRSQYPKIVDATNARAAVDSSYAAITEPGVIQPGWKLCLPEISGTTPQADAMPGESVGNLSLDAIMNMDFQSEWTELGSAKLVDGKYREPAAAGSAIELAITLTNLVASGELNGQPIAAVVLKTEPGGSGTFYDLAIAALVDGNPVNVATVSLGDRVIVNTLAIEGNEVVVDMVTHGPNDPMCCPTQEVIQRYALEDGKLKQTSVITSTPAAAEPQPEKDAGSGFGPEDVTFDTSGVGAELSGSTAPDEPYDASPALGPAGAPAHVLFSSESGGELRVIPIADYEAMWNAAGDAMVSNNIAQLRIILAKRPGLPQAPLPYLPPNHAYNDVAVQTKFLDFVAGSGIRFVGRFTQNASPVLNPQIRYVFQGLTDDGQYYVSFDYPVSTFNLADDVEGLSPEQIERVQGNYQGYLADVLDELNALSEADFAPALSDLDALIESLDIATPVVQTQAQEDELTGVTWKLVEIQKTSGETIDIQNPDRYTLLLDPDGQVSIRADCNYGKGTFTGSDSGLSMQIDTLTRALCPLDSLSDDYIRMLNESSSVVLQGSFMFVSYGIDSGTLKFEK